VVEYVQSALKERVAQWIRLFGDALLDPGSTPEKLVVLMFHIDGRPAQIIEVEQADIAPTSIVYVRDRDVVIAGDAVYNALHPMLACADLLRDAVGRYRVVHRPKLHPTMIICGHKRPEAMTSRWPKFAGTAACD
jgi:hypothetical protein